MNQQAQCPLCFSVKTGVHDQDKIRAYLLCANCKLVFVPSTHQLSATAEKKVYDQHRNSAEDLAYRKFLSRLMTPMLSYLPTKARGLDFGCGSGPTLSVMLEERGFEMAIYDPYYFHQPEVLARQYDFITATEVVEHLARPAQVFEQLFRMLKLGGVLGLMTRMIPSLNRFSSWYYTLDPTHIAFYAEESFRYLADHYGYQVEFIGPEVIIFYQRNGAP